MKVLKVCLLSLCILAVSNVALAGRTQEYTRKGKVRYEFSAEVTTNNGQLEIRPSLTEFQEYKRIKSVDIGQGWKSDIRNHVIRRWEKSSKKHVNLDEFDIRLKGRRDCNTFKIPVEATQSGNAFIVDLPNIDVDTDYVKIHVKKKDDWKVNSKTCINCKAGCED